MKSAKQRRHDSAHVFFGAELIERIERRAEQSYRSFSQQVRMMVEEWLADHESDENRKEGGAGR